MKRKNFSTLLIIIGILIISYPLVSNLLMEFNQTKVITNYQDEVSSLSNNEKEKVLKDAAEYNDKLEMESYIDVSLNNKGENLEASYINLLDIGEVMGYISIPKIGINLPIYHGIAEDVLQNGVGHVSTSSLPVGGKGTHSVLAGHSGLAQIKIFDDIDKLIIGDDFYINILDNALAYKVDDIKIVEPGDTDAIEINEEKDFVTLVTCTPKVLNTHRLLVRGVRYFGETRSNENNLTNSQAIEVYSNNTFISIILSIIIVVLIILLIIVRRIGKKQERKPKEKLREEARIYGTKKNSSNKFENKEE